METIEVIICRSLFSLSLFPLFKTVNSKEKSKTELFNWFPTLNISWDIGCCACYLYWARKYDGVNGVVA